MIDYAQNLDAFHWTLMAVLLLSMTITIAQFLSQPEMRTFWRMCADRFLINDVQKRDEARLRELGTMEGWQPQNEVKKRRGA